MIAGFHGNTDPTMIFFVLLAVVLGQQKRPAWQVGLAFGMAMNFKIVPVVLLPIFLLSLPGWRQRFAFGMAAITAIVVASLPYILIEPGFIVRRLFSYGSIYGQWGIPSLLGALPPQLAWLNAMYNIVGKYVMLVAVGSVPLWLRYLARERPSLFEQCAAAFLIFMVLTPGFGVQYLVWVVPWMIVAGFLPALLFFAASGAFLFAYYTFFAGGIPWYTAFAVPEYPLPSYIMAVGIVCWLTIVIALVCMLRSLRAQYSIRRQLAIVLASA
jgi:hypothetical protein